jgi:hypothetical protein
MALQFREHISNPALTFVDGSLFTRRWAERNLIILGLEVLIGINRDTLNHQSDKLVLQLPIVTQQIRERNVASKRHKIGRRASGLDGPAPIMKRM